jgi:hypothetical protein
VTGAIATAPRLRLIETTPRATEVPVELVALTRAFLEREFGEPREPTILQFVNEHYDRIATMRDGTGEQQPMNWLEIHAVIVGEIKCVPRTLQYYFNKITEERERRARRLRRRS